MAHEWNVDIEIYSDVENDDWAQAKYLVHGIDDVFWSDNLDDALGFLKAQIEEHSSD